MLNSTQHDPVAVIQHLEQAVWHLEQARAKSGGVAGIPAKAKPTGILAAYGLDAGYGGDVEHHDLDDAIRWLSKHVDKWLAQYGRMMWEAADTPSTLGMPTGEFSA